MIELLIIYILEKHERTLYSLRADVIEKFGFFTRPSIGTIHPAMKRLLKNGSVTMRNNFSEGGKKSTYYGITPSAKKYFKEIFFANFSENPTLFFTELQTKISTMSLLTKEEQHQFLDEAHLKLESFLLDLKNIQEDEYIKFETTQKLLLKKNISEVSSFIEFIKMLKENV